MLGYNFCPTNIFKHSNLALDNIGKMEFFKKYEMIPRARAGINNTLHIIIIYVEQFFWFIFVYTSFDFPLSYPLTLK